MNDWRWLQLEFAVLLGIALLGLARGLGYAWHALAAWLSACGAAPTRAWRGW